jgi:hypothetical protein
MKSVSFVPAILFAYAVALPAGADTCLKQIRHTDEYNYGGTVTPEENTEIEMWLGGKKMACISPTRYVIMDVGNNALIFANRRDSSYVETTLPFDWNNLLDEGAVAYLARRRTMGVVEESGEDRDVLGHRCKGYIIQTWTESDGRRLNERVERVWLTTELSIDWDAYRKISEYDMRLKNYDEALIDALSKVEGVPMLTETDLQWRGSGLKSTEEVVEIIEMVPEDDVYTLPAYFTRKDRLTTADLGG